MSTARRRRRRRRSDNAMQRIASRAPQRPAVGRLQRHRPSPAPIPPAFDTRAYRTALAYASGARYSMQREIPVRSRATPRGRPMAARRSRAPSTTRHSTSPLIGTVPADTKRDQETLRLDPRSRICQRRTTRREVLFAGNKTGLGARAKKHRNATSNYRC